MRTPSVLLLTAALLAVTAGVIAAQQVQAPADLDATMKRVGPASQAVGKAIASGAFADARTQLQTERQGILETQAFFTARRSEDGMKLAANVLAQLDALDTLLSAASVDQMAAQAQAKMVTGACMQCHMQFRVRDEMMNWILRPGSI
jgi:cytochrome c556